MILLKAIRKINSIVKNVLNMNHSNDDPNSQLRYVCLRILHDLGVPVKGLPIDEIIEKRLSILRTKKKKWYQTFHRYGYEIAGEVLVDLGSTTSDDVIITNIVVAAVVAAIGSMSGPSGVILASALTSKTLTPLLLGAFKMLDKFQVKLGRKLIVKGKQ